MPDEFADAIAAATEELGGDPVPDAPAPDPEPEPEPQAAEPEPETDKPARDASGKSTKQESEEKEPEDKPDEPEDLDDEGIDEHLTAEDLAAINEDARLQRAYKSMQRGLTKKSQAIADERKDIETLREASRYMEWIDKLPAAKTPESKSTEEAVQDTTDEIMERAKAHLGGNEQAAKILGPLVKDIAETVARNIVEKQVGPLRQEAETNRVAASESKARAAIDAFGAAVQSRGEPWNDEIINAMADEMSYVQPGERAREDPNTYFERLYTNVTSRMTKSRSRREELRRLKAARESEPSTNVRPVKEAPLEISEDMDEREAIALAVKQAVADTGWR
jgi:hypothetical protein